MQQKLIKKTLEDLNTNEKGLTNVEANARLKKNGKNIFPTGKQKNIFFILLNQFKSAIIIILFVAIALSLIIGEYANIIFIAAVILINTIIGFIQEYQAERSARRLKTHIKVMINVLRNGQIEVINSEDLVVGDIVFLESGNKIPADIRLIEVKNFKTDESILTGESEGVEKNSLDEIEDDTSNFKNNIAYAGTIVLTGRAMGVVVAVANNTEYGKIAKNIVEIKDNPSPLTIRINKFTKQISVVFLIIAFVISVILYLKEYSWYNIFFSVVALTVSAIPEGLTTGMTISLSLSSSKMAKKNVIVKQLSAVEGLGSCNIIASDKTGTLTVNEQTASKIILPDSTVIDVTGVGYNNTGDLLYDKQNKDLREHVNLITILGSSNNESIIKQQGKEMIVGGDSIDIAFKVLSIKNNTNDIILNEIARIPYESELKYSALQYEEEKKNYVTIKGSVETVLNFCDTMLVNCKNEKLDKKEIEKQNTMLAENGYRVIALANGVFDENIDNCLSLKNLKTLTFIGLVAFIDPVRQDAIESIKECQKTGVQVKMITGDHPLTAFFIGKQLGIVENKDEVATGNDIDNILKNGEDALDEFTKKIKIFARVTPMQKYEIVKSYKRQGGFIAVTGDGVNDVLALKEANIGISVGSGTDIAKETADMIITDDKFTSIVTGIDEGKRAYGNVRNLVYLLMSTGICEVILYLLSIICNLSFPLTGVQFLWLNLVTNGIQSNVFAFEKNTLTENSSKVRNPNENIFNKLLMMECFIATIYIGLTGFLLYFILLKSGLDDITARTYLLTYMVFMESMQAFNCRNEFISAFKCKFKQNPFLILTIILSFVFQITALYVAPIAGFMNIIPINFMHVMYMLIFSFTQILLMEIFKYCLKRRRKI